MAFSPSLHSLTGKAMGFSQATPTDARSYFFDTINFLYRPYQDAAEVLAYLNLSKYRTGNFYIFINDGGTLNPDGTYTGGTISTWTFKDGTANGDLVEVTGGGAAAYGDLTDATTVDLPAINTPLSQALDLKAGIVTSVVTTGTVWDIDAEPIGEQDITANTAFTLTGGTNGVSRGLRILDNTGAFTITIDGQSYDIRDNAKTSISIFKTLDGSYFVESGYKSALTTPTPPTTPVTDDTLNTYGWTDTGGLTFADAEYSINGGTSWANTTANPQTGIVGAHAPGQVLVRYKAVAGVSNPSASLANTVAFTGADVTDPQVTTMEAIDANTIEVTFDEIVVVTDETGWGFDNGAALTISGVTGTGTTILTFTIVENMLSTDTITADYNEPTGNVEDSAGNRLQSIVNDPVTNSIAPSAVVTWRDLDDMATANDGVFRNAGTGTVVDASAMTVEDFPVGTSFEFEPINIVGNMYIGFDDNPGPFAALDSGLHLTTDATNINIEKWVAGSSGGFFGTTITAPGASKFKFTRNSGDVEVFLQNPTTGPVWTSIGTLPAITGTQYMGIILDALNSGIIDAIKS